MVIGIFGENCTGKSTLAEKLRECINARIYTGKDYLRLEKNEAAAGETFRAMLREAVAGRLCSCFGNGGAGDHKGAFCGADARESPGAGSRYAGKEPWLL